MFPIPCRRLSRTALAAALFLLAAAAPAAAEKPLSVCVSIPPLEAFVRMVAAGDVTVEPMVLPGHSPATYEPGPRQMARLADTDLFVAIGVPFERAWLPRFRDAAPDMRIVQADRGIEKRSMERRRHGGEENAHGGHAHGEHYGGHAQDHGGIPDPHVWLSPVLAPKILENIRDGFIAADPEHAGAYRENCAAAVARVERLDRELRDKLAGLAGRRFMVFHPSWGYFADAYNLLQVPVEIEGKEPKPAQLAELIDMARELEVRTVFVQPQFSRRSAGVLADAIGGTVAVADPLAVDWEANLREVAERIREAAR